MPVSKHRRRGAAPSMATYTPPAKSPHGVATMDEVRQAIADPALDFPMKTAIAGVWWFRQLLLRVGDRRLKHKLSRKDTARAAILLCVAMDGERGDSDDLSPVIADLLRPYCPAPTFAEAWERVRHLPPGTVAAQAARLVGMPSPS